MLPLVVTAGVLLADLARPVTQADWQAHSSSVAQYGGTVALGVVLVVQVEAPAARQA
jgi:hypothetical protein